LESAAAVTTLLVAFRKAAMCWRHQHGATVQGICCLLQGAQCLACTPSLRQQKLDGG
jgi:hypothetical protein